MVSINYLVVITNPITAKDVIMNKISLTGTLCCLVTTLLAPILTEASSPFLLKDINQVGSNNPSSDPKNMVAIGSVTYFTANDVLHGGVKLGSEHNCF